MLDQNKKSSIENKMLNKKKKCWDQVHETPIALHMFFKTQGWCQVINGLWASELCHN